MPSSTVQTSSPQTSTLQTSTLHASTLQASVVVGRSGGLVGFNDRLVVAPDGRVTGSTRGGKVDCTLEADLADVIRTKGSMARTEATATAPPGNDRVHVWIENAQGTVQLGEATRGDELSRAVVTLLNDVQLTAAERTHCR